MNQTGFRSKRPLAARPAFWAGLAAPGRDWSRRSTSLYKLLALPIEAPDACPAELRVVLEERVRLVRRALVSEYSHTRIIPFISDLADIFDYIERFYNRKRTHSDLGYISPVQYEKQAIGT